MRRLDDSSMLGLHLASPLAIKIPRFRLRIWIVFVEITVNFRGKWLVCVNETRCNVSYETILVGGICETALRA